MFRSRFGLALNELGHAWNGEGDSTVLGRVDQAFGDEARSSRAKACRRPTHAPSNFARAATFVAVGRKCSEVLLLGSGRAIPTHPEKAVVEGGARPHRADSGIDERDR